VSRPSPGPAAMLLQHAHTEAVSVYKQAIEHSAITIFEEDWSNERRGLRADGSGMNAVITLQCCCN